MGKQLFYWEVSGGSAGIMGRVIDGSGGTELVRQQPALIVTYV